MYGEEAMTTLVAAMTNPVYDGMVIILAGYPADIDTMLDRNAGLKSRFTRFLDFPDWETSDCLAFIDSRSRHEKYVIADEAIESLQSVFASMRELPGFGNGRDVDKVWKSILECRAQRVVGNPEPERTINRADVEAATIRVLAAREPPKTVRLSRPASNTQERVQTQDSMHESPRFEFTDASPAETTSLDSPNDEKAELTGVEEDEDGACSVGRDPGVTDEVWAEIERANEAYKQLLRDMKDAEDRRKQEEARRKMELLKGAQEKLRRLAKCPAGFEWRQVGSGWRCGGGSHYVSNEELERSFMI